LNRLSPVARRAKAKPHWRGGLKHDDERGAKRAGRWWRFRAELLWSLNVVFGIGNLQKHER
jgi:hypothetical protein